MEGIVRETRICGQAGIEIEGSFNSPHTEIATIVKAQIEKGERIIVVDLRKTTFFTSNGLASLIVALKHVRAVNGTLFILGPTADMQDVFRLTRLEGVFAIVQSEDELRRQL